MSSPDKQPPQKRAYPPVYEKIIPIALVLIGAGVILMIIVAIGVALGLFL
jgi:hypothetical protein